MLKSHSSKCLQNWSQSLTWENMFFLFGMKNTNLVTAVGMVLIGGLLTRGYLKLRRLKGLVIPLHSLADQIGVLQLGDLFITTLNTLYYMESLHLLGHSMKAIVLREVKQQTPWEDLIREELILNYNKTKYLQFNMKNTWDYEVKLNYQGNASKAHQIQNF